MTGDFQMVDNNPKTNLNAAKDRLQVPMFGKLKRRIFLKYVEKLLVLTES